MHPDRFDDEYVDGRINGSVDARVVASNIDILTEICDTETHNHMKRGSYQRG